MCCILMTNMDTVQKDIRNPTAVAFMHFLGGGVLAVILTHLVIGLPITLYFKPHDQQLASLNVLLSIIGVWFGAVYSARHIKKTYAVRDAKRVIFFATIFLATSLVLPFLVNPMGRFSETIRAIGMIFVFYIASKKYIHNDPL